MRTTLSQLANAFVNIFDTHFETFSSRPNEQERILRDNIRRLAKQFAGMMDSLASLLPMSEAKLSPVTDLHYTLGRLPALALNCLAIEGFMVLSHFRATYHWLRCPEAELLAAILAVVRVQLETSTPSSMELLTEDTQGPGEMVRVSVVFDGILYDDGHGAVDKNGLQFVQGFVTNLGGDYHVSTSESHTHHEFLLPATLR